MVKARLEDEAEKKERRQQVAAGIEATPEPIVYDYHGEWRKECKELLIEQLRFSATFQILDFALTFFHVTFSFSLSHLVRLFFSSFPHVQ